MARRRFPTIRILDREAAAALDKAASTSEVVGEVPEHWAPKRNVVKSLLEQGANVRDYGAIGDGKSHQLRERFESLVEAQSVYPHATSLNDQIDWCAIVSAINSINKGRVLFATGTYLINKPIVIKRGITLYGVTTFDSAGGCVIRLANNANCDMLRTPEGVIGNFTQRTHYMAIENIAFDGNGANQTEEHFGIKFWGSWIGSYIRNVFISNIRGTALSIDHGSDIQMDHIWITNTVTDGYAMEINKDVVQGQDGYQNINHLYIENTWTKAAGFASDGRTDETVRGKGILINRSASCHITEFHTEAMSVAIDISNCHVININNIQGVHMGRTSQADCAMIRLLDAGTKVLNIGPCLTATSTSNFAFVRKATGVTSNDFPDTTAGKTYLSGYVAKNILSEKSHREPMKIINELSIKKVGTPTKILLKFENKEEDDSSYHFVKTENEYLRIGSSVNNNGEEKNFMELRATGNLGEHVGYLVPLKLATRTGDNQIPSGSLYLDKDGLPKTVITDSAVHLGVVLKGGGPPTINAKGLGYTYIDTTNRKAYISVNVGTGSTDWSQITS